MWQRQNCLQHSVREVCPEAGYHFKNRLGANHSNVSFILFYNHEAPQLSDIRDYQIPDFSDLSTIISGGLDTILDSDLTFDSTPDWDPTDDDTPNDDDPTTSTEQTSTSRTTSRSRTTRSSTTRTSTEPSSSTSLQPSSSTSTSRSRTTPGRTSSSIQTPPVPDSSLPSTIEYPEDLGLSDSRSGGEGSHHRTPNINFGSGLFMDYAFSHRR